MPHADRRRPAARLLLVTLLALPAAAAALAQAEAPETNGPVFAEGVSADDMSAAFRHAGIPFLADKDSTGDPRYKITCGDVGTYILSYDCSGGRCATLQLSLALDQKEPVKVAVANDWNADKLWGTAYVDKEGDIWIQLPFSVRGVTSGSIEDTVKHFCRTTVPDFLRHIGW
jgi:hypothetical protein